MKALPLVCSRAIRSICEQHIHQKVRYICIGIFVHINDRFWKVGLRHFFEIDSQDHPDYRRMYLLESKVERQLMLEDRKDRMNILELDKWMTQNLVTEPSKAQRSLSEMGLYMY